MAERIFYTPQQLSEIEPAFSIGSIRWSIFNRHSNGLAASGALSRNGRRWLIHREKFLNWIVENGEDDAA